MNWSGGIVNSKNSLDYIVKILDKLEQNLYLYGYIGNKRKKGYKINAKCDLNLKLVCLLEYRVVGMKTFLVRTKCTYCVCVLLATSSCIRI